MRTQIIIVFISIGILALLNGSFAQETPGESPMSTTIKLPQPSLDGKMSLEEALAHRRSRRNMSSGSLTMQQVSQILWAAQGITAKDMYRTAPSAGALYPIEIYVVVENIEGISPGLYHYSPHEHSLLLRLKGSLARKVSKAALGQKPLTTSAILVVITAEIERTSGKYGERAERYVAQEVGAVAQNIYLQVESLGLSTVLMGAFYDDKVQEALEITETPMGIMPIGLRTP